MKNSRPRAARFRIAAALMFVCAVGACLPAAAEQYGDIVITQQTAVSSSARDGVHGYVPYRFSVVNVSPDASYEVSLRLPGKSDNPPYTHLRRLTQTIDAGPSSTTEMVLYQPALPIAGRMIDVYINRRLQRDPMILMDRADHGSSRVFGFSSRSGPSVVPVKGGGFTPRILLSPGMDPTGARMLWHTAAVFGSPRMPGGARMMPFSPSSPSGAPPTPASPSSPSGAGKTLSTSTTTGPGGETIDTTISLAPSGEQITTIETKRPDGRTETTTITVSPDGRSRRESVRRRPDGTVSGRSSGGSGPSISFSGGSFSAGGPSLPGVSPPDFADADRLDPHWLSYSSYDGVLIALSDAETMTPRQIAALRGYVECGGSLAVMGEGALPAEWSAMRPDLGKRSLSSESGVERIEIGLGVLFLGGDPRRVAEMDNPGAAKITDSWIESMHAWGETYTSFGANQKMQMTSQIDTRASMRRMFVAMLLFAALIGPVHLIVLARMKRRSWVFWTTPAVSALTCAVIVVFAAVSEGWDKRSRAASFTLLDESSNRAVTFGMLGFYSPRAHNKGFQFSADAEVTPQIANERVIGSVDWTSGQLFEGGWIKARVPRHFKVRQIEARRERVSLSKENGKLTIVNGLGADILNFRYVDRDGKAYRAKSVPMGAKTELEPVPGPPPKATKKLRSLYLSVHWTDQIAALKAAPLLYLRPGQYFALLKDSAFLENPMEGAQTAGLTAAVVGISSEAGQAQE